MLCTDGNERIGEKEKDPKESLNMQGWDCEIEMWQDLPAEID